MGFQCGVFWKVFDFLYHFGMLCQQVSQIYRLGSGFWVDMCGDPGVPCLWRRKTHRRQFGSCLNFFRSILSSLLLHWMIEDEQAKNGSKNLVLLSGDQTSHRTNPFSWEKKKGLYWSRNLLVFLKELNSWKIMWKPQWVGMCCSGTLCWVSFSYRKLKMCHKETAAPRQTFYSGKIIHRFGMQKLNSSPLDICSFTRALFTKRPTRCSFRCWMQPRWVSRDQQDGQSDGGVPDVWKWVLSKVRDSATISKLPLRSSFIVDIQPQVNGTCTGSGRTKYKMQSSPQTLTRSLHEKTIGSSGVSTNLCPHNSISNHCFCIFVKLRGLSQQSSIAI